jgi:hypothetical protein
VIDKLPPSVAEVKVLRRSELGLVRSVAQGLRPLAVLLISLAAFLYALALALSSGHRRRTLLSIGFSLVASGALVLVARSVAQPQVVSAITRDASIEPAAADAYSVATSLLAQVASSAIVIGAAAWLAGPARWARAIRRFLAPHLREHRGLAYWITAALLALVFAWGPIPATRNPIEMVLFALVALLGAHLLRRQIAAEFPGEPAVSIRVALRMYAHSLLARVAQLGGAVRQEHLGTVSVADELERLAALRERGALSAEEYAAAKREVLGADRRP